MNDNELNTYECVIELRLNPVRRAASEEEFIANLLNEYNGICGDRFDIRRADITEIESDEEEE